jgi:hypothetical protein
MRPGVATRIRGVTARIAIGIRGVTTRVAVGIVRVTVGIGVPALPVIPVPLNHGSGSYYVRPVTARVAAGVTARAAAAGVAVSIIVARVSCILRIRILRIRI